jgi:uncharacterized membrane protein (DUF485 family)
VHEHDAELQALARTRFNTAIVLTLVMIAIYFGFILLIAYNKPLMGKLIMPGLSLGILLGALVIVSAWLLTWVYVRWSNRGYDARMDALRK